MKRNEKFTLEQEKEIVKLYEIDKLTTRAIGKIFNCVHRTIIKCLTRNGIKTRDALNSRISFGYDRDYFKKINTEEKAYFLGLLYADGCNTGKAFSIGLQEEDSYLIDKLQIALKAEKIKTYTRKPQKLHHKSMRFFKIMSQNMCADLNKLGLIPRKSLILNFPTEEQVPKYLIHHFIRGYFDGDGCISWVKKPGRSPVITITGSDIFCKTIYNIMEQIGVKFITTKRFKDISCTTLQVSGTFKINRFYNFIYKDSTIFMTRKKEKFDNLFNTQNISVGGSKKGRGKSIYRGVNIREYTLKGKNYRYITASVIKEKIKYTIKGFSSELDAALAYDKKCYELYGDQANLNFPENYNTIINQINNNEINLKY